MLSQKFFGAVVWTQTLHKSAKILQVVPWRVEIHVNYSPDVCNEGVERSTLRLRPLQEGTLVWQEAQPCTFKESLRLVSTGQHIARKAMNCQVSQPRMF